MNILEIEHCRKQFDGKEVLSDISLTVDEGQVLSIIGPSGSGKSTLLRCATLLETMDGGALRYLGKSAVRDENGKAVYASHAELREIRTCFKMGLADREDAYPYQLSGGQQQRVSIARALAMKPKMLFFDEPTSALDPELTGEILKVIRDLAAEHMTMVIVTHEMAFARDVSDYVIFMDGGVIVEQGNPVDIINNPSQERTIQFLARFN